MSDDTTNFDEQIPVPTLELWTLLKKYPLPKTEDGAPTPGTERLHAAHAAVAEWLARVELELGCPSYENSADWAEFAPVRKQYGLCPKCERNDGYLMVGGMDERQYWSFCHRHRVRWELDPEVTSGSFQVFDWEAWKDPFRPVGKYAVVRPINPEVSPAAEGTEEPGQFSPLHPNSARPHLRLVRSEPTPCEEEEEEQDDDCGPSEPWPPPGGASVAERAFRLLGLAYLFAIIIPHELVKDALEYLSPDPA